MQCEVSILKLELSLCVNILKSRYSVAQVFTSLIYGMASSCALPFFLITERTLAVHNKEFSEHDGPVEEL